MNLVIGLGNPGKKYAKTRHNIGFVIADELAKKFNIHFSIFKKAKAEVAVGATDCGKITLAKPQTFMNESGRAVRALLDFYKLKPKDAIIIHDDKDLPLGEIRVQTGRGPAGHNGVKSIIEHLGTQNFTRVRVGIAPNNGKKIDETADYVLDKFTKEEQKALDNILNRTVNEIEKLLK